jgi:hypothetical protein
MSETQISADDIGRWETLDDIAASLEKRGLEPRPNLACEIGFENELLVEIEESNREALLAFDDALALLNSKYSAHRHLKLLRHVTIMAEEVGGVADALDDRDAAETLVRWIHRNYDNEETNKDYRVALKIFGHRTSDENGSETPDSLDWIPSGTSSNYDPSPEPSNMLDRDEDILPMSDINVLRKDPCEVSVGPRSHTCLFNIVRLPTHMYEVES